MSVIRPLKGEKKWRHLELAQGSKFYGPIALGNMTQYTFAMFWNPRGELFVGIEGRGCYAFGGFSTPGYVQEKLGLKYEGDAAIVCDIINQVKYGSEVDKQYGEYQENFCAELGRE